MLTARGDGWNQDFLEIWRGRNHKGTSFALYSHIICVPPPETSTWILLVATYFGSGDTDFAKAGNGRQWEEDPIWSPQLCHVHCSCAELGPTKWPRLKRGQHWGRAAPLWGSTNSQFAGNRVLRQRTAFRLGGRFTSWRVEECYRLVNYTLKNILSTPLT